MEIKYRTQFGELLESMGLEGAAAEVGVAEGRNAQVLISSPAITRLYLIDAWTQLDQPGDGGYEQPWHDNNLKEVYERVAPWKEKAVIMKGLSYNMIRQIPDNHLVLAYLDGDHSYWGAYQDLVTIYNKVKSGGIIAGHDYLNPAYGVNKAVKSFLAFNGYSQLDIHVTEEDGDTSMVSFWFIKK
jgi:hypothetical protein